jgi:glycosyltransferase involved in cell wall biosynthesis
MFFDKICFLYFKAVVFTIKTVVYRIFYRLAVVSKSLVKPILSPKLLKSIKTWLLKNAFPLERNKTKFKLNNLEKSQKGVNLIGYTRAEMGIGESCRIAAKSMDAAELPFGIINFTGMNSARMTDTSWIHKELANPIYNVNVFHINAEQMMEIYAHYGNSIFQNRYNIGFWHWELPDFPDEWLESFSLVDEIWAPSSFVVDSIAMKSPVPVVKIPHGIEVKIINLHNRSYFKLPENAFLFLTMYDINSYQQRKNPQGSIKAFKLAFNPNDLTVGLVIKVNTFKSDINELKLVYDAIENYKNIYVIKETLSRDETNALIKVTDCYISLHRSEGFGLGLAEAMYLGKPAIGTNWSSNIDFMTSSNSCLVNYELINIGFDQGPYKAYQQWADPDVEHASSFMKKLTTNEDYYKKIAKKGERDIKQNFSPLVVGEKIKKRLKYLNLS